MTDTAIAELAPQVGVRDACQAVGAAQASYYRRHRQSPPRTGRRRSHTASAFSRGR